MKPFFGDYLRVFSDVFDAVGALRRPGAAALDLAHTAAGIFDGFFEFGLSAWDIAAGTLLVREAGGLVTDAAVVLGYALILKITEQDWDVAHVAIALQAASIAAAVWAGIWLTVR